MIELNIPGRGTVQLEHLVSDVNGTLAVDGKLFEGMSRLLRALQPVLQIHLLTADTHGRQDLVDQQLGITAVRLQSYAHPAASDRFRGSSLSRPPGESEPSRGSEPLRGSSLSRPPAGSEAGEKAAYVRGLGASRVIAIGQGANDAAMLKEAAIGVCVLSPEGTAVEALLAADLVVPDIYTALDLLEKPLRLVATLRK